MQANFDPVLHHVSHVQAVALRELATKKSKERKEKRNAQRTVEIKGNEGKEATNQAIKGHKEGHGGPHVLGSDAKRTEEELCLVQIHRRVIANRRQQQELTKSKPPMNLMTILQQPPKRKGDSLSSEQPPGCKS